MKKIYALFVSAAMIGSMHAQQVNPAKLAPVEGKAGRTIHVPTSSLRPSSVQSTNSRWYNYGDVTNAEITQTYPGTTSTLNGNYLFPDSTIKANFGGTYASPWIHFIGDVLDPTSSYFNDYAVLNQGQITGPIVTKTTAYTVDSLQIAVTYTRHTASTVVDSVIIEIGQGNTSSASLGRGGFIAPVATNLGTDTVWFPRLKWTLATKSLVAGSKMRYAVALTAASALDTVPGGVHYVSLALPGFAGITAGNLVATSVSFKPGFTWVANVDTLNTKGNELNFLSYQEGGSNAFPLEYKKRDYNCSYLIPTNVYYNTATSWNGSFIPSFAYEGTAPDTYGFDHHLIYYHVNCSSCFALSTNDIKRDGFAIGNAFPNPVAAGTDVVLPITLESKEKIQIAIYNVVGQRVGSVIQPNLTTGTNEVKLSTRNLEAGVYFVTITAGEAVKTVRLVVNN